MYLIASLQVSTADIIMLTAGATLLGITVFYFINTRRNQKHSPLELEKVNRGLDEWKRKYFNDIESREKQLDEINQKYYRAEENAKNARQETEKLKSKVAELTDELSLSKTIKPEAESEKTDYMSQLRQAQSSLMEHNDKINKLLQQIDVVKETEERQQEVVRINEELSAQIDSMREMLRQKESEISHIKQKQNLTSEMTSMLDNAYSEFNVLQEKIVKLEGQLTSTKMIGIEYEDLKEANVKNTRLLEESRARIHALSNENQQLHSQLEETEEKLREAIFGRQQLQKKVTYLEELNSDLKQVSEANKKLEGQIKRIGELESMLHIISEERDELRKRQEG